MTKALSLLLVMFTAMNITAFAGSQTYYAKAKATAVGNGKVYVGVLNTTPDEELYEATSENTGPATSSGSSANVSFYLFAQPGSINTKLEGWYDNAECTGDALSTDNPYQATINSNATSSSNAVTKNFYAKFVEATEFYSSTLTATVVGEGGSVAVSTQSGSEDFGTEKSASTLNSVETNHTYYLQAQVSDADAYRFVGWYSDATCETQISKNANYTYTVTAESTDEANPTEFSAYAKFEAIPYYYSSVKATAVGAGEVYVNTKNATTEEEWAAESEASQKVADKAEHTYYLFAQTEEGVEFEGWFADAECTEFLSTVLPYTYKVTSESQDPNEVSSFSVYAKFTTRNTYQVRNGGFEKWAATNEPGFGWNSFPSAVGAMAQTGKGMSPNPEKVEGRNGGSAVRLFSKYAGMFGIGANANGNLTTGRVNMGSMTPTDKSNHNFSDLENEGYFLTIAGQPDGVEFYSKYKMGDGEEHQGHAQFIIHDAVNYVDPQLEEQQEHRIGQAETSIAESEDWELQTAEFQYDWSKDDAAATQKYLLINFTTNIEPGGSKDDELILDDVRLIYNSELTGAKYDGQDITFAEGQATIDADYDATLLTDLTSNGRAASIETSYNDETGVLTITVKGQDYDFNTDNKHEYTVQFNVPQAGFDAQFQYNAETNTVTITVNDETVTYFAAVEDKDYYDIMYGDDEEYMAEALTYTARSMSGNMTVYANTIYKDAYGNDMEPDLDYYFLLAPCSVDENGWPTELVEGAPVFKFEFHCSNVNPEYLFNYTDNGDDTFTVEPKDPSQHWYAVVVKEIETSEYMDFYYGMDITSIDQAYTGTKTIKANDLYEAQNEGESMEPGDYIVIVGTIGTGSDEEGDFIYAASTEQYSFTQHLSTGVGTVLRPEATKTIYNLQGQRLQRQQRGVNLVGSKKVVK